MLVRAVLCLVTLGETISSSNGLSLWPDFLTPTVSWNEEYLNKKISIRLVSKSWKPNGITSNGVVDEFPGDVETAFNILWNDKGYQYLEKPLNQAEQLFTMKDDKGKAEYNPALPSIIIVHPLQANADVPFVKTTITALAMRNIHKKYNIFAANFPDLNINAWISVIREAIGHTTKYEPMTKALSSFFIKGIVNNHWRPDQIHLLGFSYSGNFIGYMARYINMLFNQKLGSLVCLDPYSVNYNADLIHVSRDDAKIVHIYHTCSISGTSEKIATADIVFNDGLIQPECNTRFKQISCSHMKVVQRFWYIILFPSKFVGRRCDTWPRFKTCLCNDNQQAAITYPVGSSSVEGVYFLKTTGTRPYGMGEVGSKCKTSRQMEQEKKKKNEIEIVFKDINAPQKALNKFT